ncbi:Lipocalin-like domain-containing protein [Neohortaea acidophila]|uniref:Lipocalin-like domain-containing protein n=1 Tax=Neohortaea acidophila TaxID=245834 RepID=A0A6A6Q443_9PEZI|nr:Lipocalin-like domain-containing protein [Neohortaea acidophila]KAF2487228.1 Lipocalin-like domain-containing protein [Neohortaea acidophila]
MLSCYSPMVNMAGSSSQFLQVPKIPLRRPKPQPQQARARSRSRPRSDRPEAVISPIAARPQSPPMPAADSHHKPSLNGFSSHTAHPMTKDITPTPPTYYTPTPDVKMNDVTMADDSTGTNYDDLSTDLNGGMYTLEQCVTPPPEIPLRQKLIGTWKLESYIAYPTPTSVPQRPTYPMTKNVTGFIMYTPDGYMSAQMLIPGQQTFKRGEGDDAQWTEAAKRFFAYSGPFYITDEGPGREETLRHTFQICNLPGWVGDIQIRTHRFEENGEVLVLGSEELAEIKGDKRKPELRWRRARCNLSADPPPPTPQIKISGPEES